MTVNRVMQYDYGKYKCVARNKMGENQELIQLDVTSPPDQPSDLEVYNVTHDSVMLIWKRGFDGGLPTSHQIRWRQALDNEERYHYLDVSPGDYKALITGLSLGTYYVFSIKAMNSKGDSHFLPDLVKVQTLRKYHFFYVLLCSLFFLLKYFRVKKVIKAKKLIFFSFFLCKNQCLTNHMFLRN